MISFDHFIYGVPKLEDALVSFQEKTGVNPALGGKHVSLGTHNALVSLGDCYFEFLSPDPSRTQTTEVGVETLKGLKAPRMIAWALQCSDFKEVELSLKPYQMSISQIERGSRQTPDGTILNYEFTTIIGATGPDGTIPFFVKWINTIHPSITSPKGCQLESFSLRKSLSNNFMNWIPSTSVKLNFASETDPLMKIKIKTPKSIIQFDG